MLLIQYMRHTWDKSGRNIEGARERSARPTEMSFQTAELPQLGECWIQGGVTRRGNCWIQSHKTSREEWTDRVQVGPVECVKKDDCISTTLSSGQWCWTPNQFDVPKPVILELGETVRYFLQYREVGYDDAWFERHVVNVAWLQRFDSEVFRLRPFTYEVRYRSPLAV